MINQIYSEEVNGEQVIYLPYKKTNIIILICPYIFIFIIVFCILYIIYGFGIIMVVIVSFIGGIIYFLGDLLRKLCCPPKCKLKKIKMSKNIEEKTLIIKKDNKKLNVPLNNIRCFSYLKGKGKGIYLELVTGVAIKIESYEYEDPIIERAVLEFSRCLYKL